ncbi:glycosyltransferase-like protein, family 2 [Candidatus Magnetobacterium bavaricum]|uniref:Glycosyltransferase-like protein, family 2 n=1 Tax=Candidatus Magnetobacterium bavaricum TaxID=29290 RepID=A0A0F3GJF6_9BACT|nr:glycosyltransferase-like protein, family 2 [Candidatus Magnetobacterium bavaricum]
MMNQKEIKKGLVSVIMPTYNHGHFIGEAIESVLNQTYKYLELIIIDNYSKDNTENIIHYFGDSRIKYIKFHNQGIIGASRNVGIRMASGEYIAFLDSDDFWLPEKLEKQVSFLETNNDYFLIYSKCYTMIGAEIQNTLPRDTEMKSGYTFKHLFMSNNFILTLTVMIRNTNKNDNLYLFNEANDLIAIEDYDLWLKIAKNKKIGYINTPLAVYRIHDNNLSKQLIPYLKRHMKILLKYRTDIDSFTLIKKFLYVVIYIAYHAFKKIIRSFKTY